jgi:hypothetical protein
MAASKVDFPTFFAMWADTRGWDVPDIHWRAVHWLENRGKLAVLRCFRGFGKSTILAIYNAWRLYRDPAYRILHQGDQDKTAYKTSRDTKSVLLRHPLTKDWMRQGTRGESAFWWVPGADDERNPSMQAAGITSTVTSSRCEEAQNDDVEVPKNITNPENREKMRYRLGEQVHVMVPGACQLFIGTPHTHDSLYDEMERKGADCLTIKMFEHEYRIEQASEKPVTLRFAPEVVFAGIGENAKLLKADRDYTFKNGVFCVSGFTGTLIDVYAGHAWPKRFDQKEMLKRRVGCRTVNEWDSQYQLHSRPIHEVRLDPERIEVYDVEPRFERQNKQLTMWLGKAQIVGCSLRWDPSSGKLGSDVSALVLDLQDGAGRHYWHKMQALTGDICTTSPDGRQVTGGQVWQLCDVVEKYHLSRVTVETNGIGKYAPSFLRMALKQRRLSCTISEQSATTNKNSRILEALEPLLQSGMLWAHRDVLAGPLWDQMKEWNPAVKDQPDDYLDAGAGSVTDQPARVGQFAAYEDAPVREGWRPDSGVYEVEYETALSDN